MKISRLSYLTLAVVWCMMPSAVCMDTKEPNPEALTHAIMDGEVEKVEKLLKENANPNYTLKDFESPLILAIGYQDKEKTKSEQMVRLLFNSAHKFKPGINIKHTQFNLPVLHYALTFDVPSENIVRILLAHGAEKDEKAPADALIIGFQNKTSLAYVEAKLKVLDEEKKASEEKNKERGQRLKNWVQSFIAMTGFVEAPDAQLKKYDQQLAAFQAIRLLLAGTETKEEVPVETKTPTLEPLIQALEILKAKSIQLAAVLKDLKVSKPVVEEVVEEEDERPSKGDVKKPKGIIISDAAAAMAKATRGKIGKKPLEKSTMSVERRKALKSINESLRKIAKAGSVKMAKNDLANFDVGDVTLDSLTPADKAEILSGVGDDAFTLEQVKEKISAAKAKKVSKVLAELVEKLETLS